MSNTEDTNLEKAKALLANLTKLNASTLFPTTAMCEAVTALKGRLNKPAEAYIIIEKLQNESYPLHSVDPATVQNAARLLTPTASKKNTLFDAIIATLSKQLNADAIFSFDGWYRKVGCTLVSDFI